MNDTTESLLEQKLKSTAQELSDNGYKVLIEPSSSDLPFELGGYRPDLIAIKNDEGIVLEIKTSLNRLSVDRFQEIAERIASHSGWRFLLVTLDDIDEKILLSNQNELPSWDDLNSQLNKLNLLIHESLLEPALLFFWSILEAAMRKRSIFQNIPIWRFPENNLLRHIFSSGEISVSDFDLFNTCLELKNKSAHGIKTAIDPEILKSAYSSIRRLVEKWGKERS